MTLYVFPDPLAAARAVLMENQSRWPDATFNLKHPGTLTSGRAIQYAWDGTPEEQVQREFCVLRITVWAPKGRRDEAIDTASLVRAVFLDAGSSDVWRYTRAAGRIAGREDATGNEFCSFLLTAETRPTAVA